MGTRRDEYRRCQERRAAATGGQPFTPEDQAAWDAYLMWEDEDEDDED